MTKRSDIDTRRILTAIIPNWCSIALGTSVAIWAGFAFMDKTGLSSGYLQLRSIMIGLGIGGVATCVPELINALFQNIWPRYEARCLCADVWNSQRMQQIDMALRSSVPADALRSVYTDDTFLDFDSDEIYRAIGAMHEGAFLAAVDLWDPEAFNEDFLQTDDSLCTSEVQSKILGYRHRVATQITKSHIIAARRYRVKAADNRTFVERGIDQTQYLRLKSLALLVENVNFDHNHGWIVDVEYCDNQGRHYPGLDYSLLFGAQTPRDLPVASARVAYITDCRRRLIALADYVGVRISDPVVITSLMEDRFWAAKEILQADEFLEKTVNFLNAQYATFYERYDALTDHDKAILVYVKTLLDRFNQSQHEHESPEKADNDATPPPVAKILTATGESAMTAVREEGTTLPGTTTS